MTTYRVTYRRSGVIGGRREHWTETHDFEATTKADAAAQAIRLADNQEAALRGTWDPIAMEEK